MLDFLLCFFCSDMTKGTVYEYMFGPIVHKWGDFQNFSLFYPLGDREGITDKATSLSYHQAQYLWYKWLILWTPSTEQRPESNDSKLDWLTKTLAVQFNFKVILN